MSRFSKTLFVIVSLMAVAWLRPMPATAQPFPTREWQVSSPEEQGMGSETLTRLVEFGGFNNMDSLLIARRGKIVVEATYAPFRDGLKHRINSSTKAVTSTLIAIALKEGVLDSVDRRVIEFFPDRTIANLDDRKKAITIRHLLDMTSGLGWDEGVNGGVASFLAMERSPDWVQYILDRPMATDPGSVFYYNSGNSQLLSAILTKLTGKSAFDYAKEKLFGPLGIDDVSWRHDPQGVSAGGAGLYMLPRDMAKFGYLYLRNGAWEGRQIVPTAWIDGVRGASVDMRESWSKNLRYGSQFWVIPGRDTFMSVGYDRQLVVVMPKLDIVVATTGSARFLPLGGTPSRPRYGLETLVGHVAAAVKAEGPVAADPAGMAALAKSLADATRETPAPVGSPPPALARTISGKVWRFPDNPMNIKSVTYTLDGPDPSYSYDLRRPPPGVTATRFGGPIGFDGHYRVGGRMLHGPSASRGAWQDDGKTLVIETQTLGNDDVVRATHVFTERTVDLTFETATGFEARLRGEAEE
ncbi:serine hydrolase domain-containing protein [Reyranella sp.]|uniref:serine hydrolase domain-containing protein n=1 Tax=Reyranella sp. TaxID=1929291 RepID=UPI00378455CE